MSSPAELYDAVREEAGTVLIGNEEILEGLTVALLTGGHVLLEGVPGIGKTTIANLFARTTGLTYRRLQMTPDILPADITGTNVYRETTGQFEIRKGPVFANVIVADEINRATPKAQAALLEAMQERHVTIEGETLPLPDPFMVVATQNPLEMEGSLHPDESLYMNDGLWTANDALAHAKEHGTLIHESEDTRTYDADLHTKTLDESGQLRTVKCLLYETDYNGEVCEITTKTGRQISVSDNHPFLVNRDGVVQWVDADALETGDHLVSPAKLHVESQEFVSHESTLASLAEEYPVVRRGRVKELKQRRETQTLSRVELADLRIACGLSKKSLADHVSASYDQVLNFFGGCENGIGDDIQRALQTHPIEAGDYIESHRIHRFHEPLSNEEAGFFVGFILSDGHVGEYDVSITQKKLPEKFDRWVRLAKKLGMTPRIQQQPSGARQATLSSKPFVEYLHRRYRIDEPDTLLDAPDEFRRSFLEIFLLAESQYDSERRRITFVQKDRETTNLIAHLLLQYGIRPWIMDKESRYEIQIQGEDIPTYLEQFEWRGPEPDDITFTSRQRTLPLPTGMMERIVDTLGLRFEGDFSKREWYNAYKYAWKDGGPATERLSRAFVSDIESELELRKTVDIHELAEEDLGRSAKLCGISMTDIADGSSLTSHRLWKTYEGGEPPAEALDFVVDRYSDRVQEAEHLAEYIGSLVDGDVFYDPVIDINRKPYDGPVIGLSVPQTHNYLAGLGACGFNHNTFVLPEAQRDRFQLKLAIGLPDRDDERAMLDRFDRQPNLDATSASQVTSPEAMTDARLTVAEVYVDEKVREYVLDVVTATRESPHVQHGASPRASLAFLNAGKARAAIHGRDYVIPDDVKALAGPVLRHRLILTTDADLSDVTAEEVIDEVLASVTAPGAEELDLTKASD